MKRKKEEKNGPEGAIIKRKWGCCWWFIWSLHFFYCIYTHTCTFGLINGVVHAASSFRSVRPMVVPRKKKYKYIYVYSLNWSCWPFILIMPNFIRVLTIPLLFIWWSFNFFFFINIIIIQQELQYASTGPSRV